MIDKCKNEKNHTEAPEGFKSYIDWHEWASNKSKTHSQVKCKDCGLFEIWIRRKL